MTRSRSRRNRKIPLIWSEFNATYMNEQPITDSIYMGPWLADTISKCDGKTLMMSYWSFSDVFEEQGVVKTPFYGGYGMVAEDGIPKPAYDVFMLLHELGDERLEAPKDEALVTRRKDGTLVIAAWNLVEPGAQGADKTVTFDMYGVGPFQPQTHHGVAALEIKMHTRGGAAGGCGARRHAGCVEEDGKSGVSERGSD